MPSLLLTHPSLSADPAQVSSITAMLPAPVAHQMLDRLAAGAVLLPKAQYDVVRIAPAGTVLSTNVVAQLADAVLPGGKIEGAPAQQNFDAIMNGFLVDDVTGDSGVTLWSKPAAQKVVLLKRRQPQTDKPATVNIFSKQSTSAATSISSPALSAHSSASTTSSSPIPSPKQNGIWTVDIDDGFDFNDADNDLIDEDDLLDGELPGTITIPESCQVPGKRRKKACKDCTCGLKELELQEEEARRQKLSNQVFKLNLDDTAEIDFTVPGKTGSCGNCSLGDAFRCDGCPYLGLPPFKEGEVVSLDALGDDML
ncbi:cytokine-induced anti-apoptosis inhibitor 1, Fe-S biogenesis-domain-containing protein [Limtongia smithiae]|uniref:cytokine-induced anti-apoptosis inhibitor 1, Fe-S biogenesis-domain-containing protein n=1 Tax=Limtongia smithiae TaxID=1125753 RepID=UPI0034CD98F7